MTPPRVSVLLPVRDEAPYLADAMQSLSDQTFDDFEAIVVDDGSTDGSDEIALEHALGDRRFRVIRTEPRGIVAALEDAREEARGRYLARMDGDDIAFPHRLARQIEALEAEGLSACGGGIEYFPPDHVRNGARRYERWINSLVTHEAAARDVFVECPLPHTTTVVRREALDAVGGYRSCGWPEDYGLVLRLFAHGARFRNVDEVVLRWREHSERESRTGDAYTIEAFVRCKVHHLRATLLAGRESVVVWGAGPVGKAFARELLRARVRVEAFVDVDPRKIGHRVAGAPVVAVEEATRFQGSFAISAVSGAEGRSRARQMVADQGRRDGVDFVAVA